MSKTPLLLALLSLLVPASAVVAGPPQGPSGRLVLDAVPELQDEVKKLEKEVTADESKGERLAMARARLLAAEGRTTAARVAWKKIVTAREEWASRLEPFQSPGGVVILQGYVAEVRCGLAEVEGDRATLTRELTKLIASYELHLETLDTPRKHGDYDPQETEEERTSRKELRQARQRLDAVKRRRLP